MKKEELIECIEFFKELKVVETDVTSEEERRNHCKVVVVSYSYLDQNYTTKRLYYKNILHQTNIKNPQDIINKFGGDVYWLDMDINVWPEGKGANIEKTVIKDMVQDSQPDFEVFLKRIANNSKNGFLQKITSEGKSAQYGVNMENNNHWHDLINFVKFVITTKGQYPPNEIFQRLVFEWDNNERTSFHPDFGHRKYIHKLVANIKAIQNIITDMEIIKVLYNKKQIILQGPPGTGKTYTAKDIAEQILFSKVSDDKKQQKALLESSEQFKLIQFHPAYSYEDFVRGIVVKTDITNAPEYKTVNKTLGEFAKKANESNLQGGTDDFDRAWYELVQDINDSKVKKIGSSDVEVDINSQGNIRFKSPVATYERTYELYKFGKTDLKYETYHRIVLSYLKNLKHKYKLKDYVSPKSINSNKPYVLIIDEINRANLPAVLGELIYALEYRGEKVESMYATTEESNTLILPPNLYIIGTMNTSDRSVGHIDYAIRRRFAFVEILPKVLKINNFELELFKQVSALFIQNFDEYVKDNTVELKLSEHLSEEFRPEDVWLGHSYFINGEEDFSLRKKYEIVPILKEYLKDGILKQSAEPIINSL